jgi:hypothetical protein
VAKALELYYLSNGVYPSTGSSARFYGVCGAGGFGGYPDAYVDATHDAWIPGLTPTYMAKLPHDQNTSKTNPNSTNAGCRTTADNNCYVYASNGTDYKLVAYCLPEGTLSAADSFYDPGWGSRGGWSWAVFSPGASAW